MKENGDGYLKITICDDGIYFKKSIRTKIFNIFNDVLNI